MKRHYILLLVLLVFTLLFSVNSFAKGERAKFIKIALIYPQKSNAPQRVLNISNAPVTVSGKLPVIIPKKPNLKDTKEGRYLVEYFIDEILVYKTNGIIEGVSIPSFDWVLDTTQYENGEHKIIVNYWDSKGPSAIGIKNIIIKNPILIEYLGEN